MEITFDSIPKALSSLMSEVSDIKRMLIEQPINDRDDPDKIFTVPQAAEFLNLTVPTVYSLISRGELAALKRNGRCYFSKADLVGYLKAGRVKPNYEIQAEASDYLKNKKGPKHGR